MATTYPEKECEICGIYFIPKTSTQKYCPDCGKHSDAAWKKMKANINRSIREYGTGRKMEPIQNTCKQCGKVFETWRHVKKYCSSECKKQYNIEHTFCAWCGKPMTDCNPIPERSIHARTPWLCSDACKEAYNWDIAAKTGTIRICKHCGKKFISKRPAIFCNNDCYQAAVKAGYHPQHTVRYRICPICHKQFPEPAINGCCSTTCAEQKELKQVLANETWNQTTKMETNQAQRKIEEKQKAYIEKNGLCGICRTSYMDCERMTSGFRLSPNGSKFKGSLVIACPKFTAPKKMPV